MALTPTITLNGTLMAEPAFFEDEVEAFLGATRRHRAKRGRDVSRGDRGVPSRSR